MKIINSSPNANRSQEPSLCLTPPLILCNGISQSLLPAAHLSAQFTTTFPRSLFVGRNAKVGRRRSCYFIHFLNMSEELKRANASMIEAAAMVQKKQKVQHNGGGLNIFETIATKLYETQQQLRFKDYKDNDAGLEAIEVEVGVQNFLVCV